MNAYFDPDSMTVAPVDLGDHAQAAKVDAFVLGQEHSSPFHRPAWVRAVADGTGQKAHYLAASTMGGQIVGVLPLTEMQSRLFGRALVSSGFAVGGGILTDNALVADQLADACWALAGQLSCTSVELRGGVAPSDGWVNREDTYLGFCKALEADDEAQLLAVPKRHRAEIRKGLGNDLVFETGRDRRLRDAHYTLFAQSVHALGTPVFPRSLFDAVLDAFGEDADIAMISHDGTPVSAALNLYHNGACMPYWHGAGASARGLRSNEVLYYRLMNLSRERGLTHFDFGRSKVGTGPAAWKKNWGWDPEPLSYSVRAVPGHEVRDVNPLSPQYRRKVNLWKKLPLGLANRIGPYIARGLG
ncbi:MAG: FemAB family PEP-CTERM system-associated protein [Alphaproteobacteria bacterium]|nr:FemAB family PEP-CTERM system-associated protein [Alphaproteobacteria bacterium]